MKYRPAIELLQSRLCMDAAWQNVSMPMDVNHSGTVTPLDALNIINYLNRGNPVQLPASRPADSPFYDCDGDGMVKPLDALVIINALNRYNQPLQFVVNLDPDQDPNANRIVSSESVHMLGMTLANVSIEAEFVFDQSYTLQLAQTQSDAEGMFIMEVPLAEGDNPLRFTVTDPLGRSQSIEMLITKSNLVRDWNATILNVVREWTTTSNDPYEGRIVTSAPPRVARNLAMIHTAMFDAINAVEGKYQPYLNGLTAPANISVEAAAAEAAYTVAKSLYPEDDEMAYWNATRTESLAGVPEGISKNEGLVFGQFVGNAMLALRSQDGGSATKSYVPGDEPGDWNRTAPGFLPPLLPQWPEVTPFTIESVIPYRAPVPPALDTPEYATAVDEVMRLGRVDSTTRTADQTNIAIFWADGGGTFTPPGHWNQIAAEATSTAQLSLLDTARTFAMLNLALADAGIAAWDSKYAYDLWRPIDAIRDAALDNNPATSPDATWTPLLPTPPFPTYTSGHSTFSGAADAVLTSLFGSEFAFTSAADAHSAPGQRPLDPELVVSRSFGSFTEAAEEAGLSRIYGGIHYSFDNTAGLDAGRGVGQYVASHALQLRPAQ